MLKNASMLTVEQRKQITEAVNDGEFMDFAQLRLHLMNDTPGPVCYSMQKVNR